MNKELKNLETRLANLERAFLMSQKNNVNVTEHADEAVGFKPEITSLRENVNDNTVDIASSQLGLAQSYELGVTNSTDILDIQLAVADLYEMIITS